MARRLKQKGSGYGSHPTATHQSLRGAKRRSNLGAEIASSAQNLGGLAKTGGEISMNRKGKYIYGIIEESSKRPFHVKGIGGGQDIPYTLPHGPFSAVVSDVPIQVYENTEENLLAHNRVLEEVMKIYDVFPIRFGTVAESEEAVHGLLKTAAETLQEAIGEIKGRVEYNIEIEVEEKKLIEKLRQTSAVIRQVVAMSQGSVVTTEDQIKIGKVVAQELIKEKLRLAAFLKNALTFGTVKMKSLRLPRPETLLNLAFLLYRKDASAFESLIRDVDQKLEDRVRFKITGPLPPFHFTELKLLVIDFDAINRARKELGLPEEATRGEIKKAYRILAKKFHPDQAKDSSEAEETFRQIDSSYKMLSKYCERYPRLRYRFRPEEFEGTIFLLDRNPAPSMDSHLGDVDHLSDRKSAVLRCGLTGGKVRDG